MASLPVAIRRLIEVRKKYQLPIVLSGLTTPLLMDELRQAGVPVLENPVEAVRLLASLSHLFRPRAPRGKRSMSDVIVESIPNGVYPERESLEVLASVGVATVESLFANSKSRSQKRRSDRQSPRSHSSRSLIRASL